MGFLFFSSACPASTASPPPLACILGAWTVRLTCLPPSLRFSLPWKGSGSPRSVHLLHVPRRQPSPSGSWLLLILLVSLWGLVRVLVPPLVVTLGPTLPLPCLSAVPIPRPDLGTVLSTASLCAAHSRPFVCRGQGQACLASWVLGCRSPCGPLGHPSLLPRCGQACCVRGVAFLPGPAGPLLFLHCPPPGHR